MNIGYARVSTQDQNLDLQRQALEKSGCSKIYDDVISGIRQQRPGLTLALEVLRTGDAFVVWKLDRLGRSVKGLVNLVGELEGKGIHFKSLTDDIDTSTPAGRFFFHVMASLAQMEAGGTSPKLVAKDLGVSVPTLYRWIPAGQLT